MYTYQHMPLLPACIHFFLFYCTQHKQDNKATLRGQSWTATVWERSVWMTITRHNLEICPMYTQAWEEDPLDTLKLMAHLRDVRDGKAEQKAFRLCVKWLYEKHPLTLIESLQEIVEVRINIAQSYVLHYNMSETLCCSRLVCDSCCIGYAAIPQCSWNCPRIFSLLHRACTPHASNMCNFFAK